ncbi:MAG: aminoglycoside phosphotransferase family protein [Chloroflexi bacterium]|nr:aminoglycoside phosphotransferase family protein [Chloroflexota bacterium]
MNMLHAARLCAIFGLGELIAEPQVVTGGVLHRMWYLPTTQGTFAVKQLNPAIMCKPAICEACRLTEQVAHAMVAQGLPAVAALYAEGCPMQEIEDATFMVYPWIDGKILLPGPVEPDLARQIGTILGRVHALNLEVPGLALPIKEPFFDDDWDMLTFHAADMDIPWAYQMRAALPRLLEWSKMCAETSAVLHRTLVVSHRDLGQKHVIWRDAHTPMIIDWEAAGLINPTVELLSVALSWSGQTTGVPREESFAAVMEGYISAGGKVQETGIDALHGLIEIWLGWLLFNMRRSLGETTASEDERQLGIRETTSILAILRSITTHAGTWAAWLDKWR